MGTDLLPKDIFDKYEVHEWKHACAILKSDFPEKWFKIVELLRNFKLCKSWLTKGGDRKSKVAEAIDGFLYSSKGWREKELNVYFFM